MLHISVLAHSPFPKLLITNKRVNSVDSTKLSVVDIIDNCDTATVIITITQPIPSFLSQPCCYSVKGNYLFSTRGEGVKYLLIHIPTSTYPTFPKQKRLV